MYGRKEGRKRRKEGRKEEEEGRKEGRVKEGIRWELKGGCDIKPVKKGFVIVSGRVLISDSMVCDQGEGKERKVLYGPFF